MAANRLPQERSSMDDDVMKDCKIGSRVWIIDINEVRNVKDQYQ